MSEFNIFICNQLMVYSAAAAAAAAAAKSLQ